MKLYVDVDTDGNIIDALSGISVVPTKTYQHEFDVDDNQINQLYRYKVVNGNLVEMATLPEVVDNIKILTPEQEMERLKKENEMNAHAIMELAEILMGGGA